MHNPCPGCKYRRRITGTSHIMDSSACHYAYDTGELRGCSAKECYEKKIHYDNSENSYCKNGITLFPDKRIRVLELDEKGRIAKIYQSVVKAAASQNITPSAMHERIKNKTIKNGHRWIKLNRCKKSDGRDLVNKLTLKFSGDK